MHKAACHTKILIARPLTLTHVAAQSCPRCRSRATRRPLEPGSFDTQLRPRMSLRAGQRCARDKNVAYRISLIVARAREVCCCLHAAGYVDKAVVPDLSQELVSLGTVGDFDNVIYLCPANCAAFDARNPSLAILPSISLSTTSTVGKGRCSALCH